MGFGCIYDGNILIQYDHFDPEFRDCTEHRSDGITLLCAACHDKKTRGRLTGEMVALKNSTPFGVTNHSAWTNLDWAGHPLEVVIGSNVFRGVGTLLSVCGVDVLKVERPEETGGPFRLSGRFFDSTQTEMLRISENHVEAMATSWDVVEIQNRITIREALNQIALQIVHEPPSRFVVEKLSMRYGDHLVALSEDGVRIDMVDSPIGPHNIGFISNNIVDGKQAGIIIPAEGGYRIGAPRPTDAASWASNRRSL